ncbi:MAG TPA: 30S ribosomal protein S5 [Candidatus Paceibacterota bacterium]
MEDQKNKNNNTGERNRPDRRHGGFRGAPKEKSEFDSQMLDIARVTRVTKGGKRFTFRATIVIGDGKGRVGVGVAQGLDVAQSMQKATNKAKGNLITVPIKKGTIPHSIEFKYNSAVVLLKPAPLGTGVKAGGPVRAVLKLVGIKNITGKLIERTGNKINIARATVGALGKLKK